MSTNKIISSIKKAILELEEAIGELPESPDPVGLLEDETWFAHEIGGVGAISVKYCKHSQNLVCVNSNYGTNTELWPQRAKRIVAGQEALKLIESKINCWRSTDFTVPAERILAMLKD